MFVFFFISTMDFKREFPQIFDKTLVIKLDKINSVVSEQQKLCSLRRNTRSKNHQQNQTIEWARVKSGYYKGDLAQIQCTTNQTNKSNCMTVHIFPRINHDTFAIETSSKRRPIPKSLDLDTIK